MYNKEKLPVSSPAQPLQVVKKEGVMGSAAVHEAVGNDCARVADGHSDSVLGLLEDQQVGLVVADQELKRERKVVQNGKINGSVLTVSKIWSPLQLNFFWRPNRSGLSKAGCR